MASYSKSWILVVGAFLAAACLGCRNGEPPIDADQSGGQSGNTDTARSTPDRGSQAGNDLPVEAPPPRPTIPKVVLTQEQLDTCLVQDGDVMHDAELSDLDGKPHTLLALRAEKKLSVVCFWKSGETPAGELKALEILGDLQDLSDANSEKGVVFIGINEGDSGEAVRQCIAGAKVTFPNLLDPEGLLFHKVATEWLPRVYLLDAEGRILWFDLEFSLTTVRRLKEGIEAALTES